MTGADAPPTRISVLDRTPDAYAALGELTGMLDGRAEAVGLTAPLRALVRIRASQINGCTFCVALHTREARAGGETPERLDALPGWAGSALFDERERAALALTESVTLVHDGGVPDDVYRRAAGHFDDDRLAVLLWTVSMINVYNRLAIATGLTASALPG